MFNTKGDGVHDGLCLTSLSTAFRYLTFTAF